jgi:hypothetical protein
MKNLVFVLLLVVVAVNARWSVYQSKADGDKELDWWENGVYYQVC